MATIKLTGLVLRQEDAGEANKRFTILSEQMGKLQAFARGAKNPKSKLAVKMLTYCEFILYEGENFFSLTQMTSLQDFSQLAEDYDAYVATHFILELADKMLLADMDGKNALNLIMIAFSRLVKKHDTKLVLAAFIFKFLQSEGYRPALNGDFFGSDGLGESGRQIAAPTAEALRYIISSEIKNTFSFKTSEKVAAELLDCALGFLRANVDLRLNSMKFFSA